MLQENQVKGAGGHEVEGLFDYKDKGGKFGENEDKSREQTRKFTPRCNALDKRLLH